MQLLHDSNFQCYFNPLPRKEGDAAELRAAVSDGISIHSLVKRETKRVISANMRQNDFNPLPRKEGDDL